MNTKSIVVKQSYGTPITVLWQAITDIKYMREWFFNQMTEFEARVGFETHFDVIFKGETYNHIMKVTEAVQEKRIAYTWRYEGYPGDSIVSWEIAETAEGVDLTLTHTGHESLVLSQDDLAVHRENCEAGWKYFLHESLPGFLEHDHS